MAYRTERINGEMQKAIAAVIATKMNDPRLRGMVGVTGVLTAKDLKTAKVYVSVYGDSDAAAGALEALKNSAGFIRRELAAEFSHLRSVPQLTFIRDASAEYGEKIDAIIGELKSNDAK
ncbi:MAG: 30S ribosome-binding factor RbfA [Clostridiales bacterium]|jgi:ribosome-binding factor A|nr:30S ribosome-binding factor RbfA [Clostridiales bacterium]